jgi:GGDEF domain-containing protein
MEGSLKALLERFANLLGDEAMIGRWSEDVFAAVLDATPEVGEKLRERAELKLSGKYAVQENGLSRTVSMEVRVGLIEREKADDAALFCPKLAQIATVVVLP